MIQTIDQQTAKEFRRIMLFREPDFEQGCFGIYQVVKPRRHENLSDVSSERVSKISDILMSSEQPQGYFGKFPVYGPELWTNEWEAVGRKYNGERSVISLLNGNVRDNFHFILDTTVTRYLNEYLENQRICQGVSSNV